jgi:Cu-Zn family superoxide dismutase
MAYAKSCRACRVLLAGLLLVPYATTQGVEAADRADRAEFEARIAEIGGSGVNGRLVFQHAGAFISIQGEVTGLTKGKHGLHVHEGKVCDQRGGHYNPSATPHGSPDQPYHLRHVGDLGNLVATEGGTARYSRIDALARLAGPHSIVGRALVVHQGEDDYTSQPSGNSGTEIACGIIRPLP